MLGFAFGFMNPGIFMGAGSTAVWAGGIYGASLAGTLWNTFNKPKQDDFDTGTINRFDKVMNTMSSTAPIPVIYGERKWAGNQTYHKTNAEQNTLRKHIVLCEGDIEGVISVCANDLLISTGGATNGTVFTVQNVKHSDATVMIKSKWMTLYANGKTSSIYLANKDDYERNDLYDYNMSVSALVSYINRLGEGWQAYPTASTNSYPGELYGVYGIYKYLNRNKSCFYRTTMDRTKYYCPHYNDSPYYTVHSNNNSSASSTIKRDLCPHYEKDSCGKMDDGYNGVSCYNSPQNVKAPTVKGDTHYTFHDGDCPDTYLETGSYKKCAWIDLNLAVSDELNGNPNVTCVVRGKKVLDTRTGKVAYSTNPAMCTRDFLLSKRYGGGRWVTKELIDEQSFIEIADYCDEEIQYIGADGSLITAKRYELNMVIDSQKNAINWLGEMLDNFCGFLVWSKGKYSLRVEKAEPISYKFNDDNTIDMRLDPLPQDETPNKYEISFVDPLNNWSSVKSLVEDFADQKERQKIITKSVELNGVTSQHQALRLGRFYRDYNAVCPIQLSFTTGAHAMHLEPGDVVTLSYHGIFTDLPLRITEIKETNKGTFEISGRQYNPDIYNDDLGASIQWYNYAEVGTPLAGRVPEVTNITLAEDGYKDNSTGIYIGHVSIGFKQPKAYPYVSSYEVWYSYDETNWIYAGNSLDTSFTIQNTQVGQSISVRVTVVNTAGRKSDGVVSNSLYLTGYNSPPSAITNFAVAQYSENYSFVLEGKMPSEPDVVGVELRIDGDDWNSAERICEFTAFPYALRNVNLSEGTHVFRVKAVDNVGNVSENDTRYILTSRNPNTFKNIILERDDIQTGEYTLKGLIKTKSGILVPPSALRYDDIDTYNDVATYDSQDDTIEIISGAIDTYKVGMTGINFVFDIGMYNTECTYDYLGDKTYDDIGNDTYDSIRTNSYKDVYVRFSEDGQTWSDWQLYIAADYTFRYIQYKIIFYLDNDSIRVEVRSLKQYYDVPDVEFSITTTTNDSGTSAVAFEGSDFYYEPKQISCVILGAKTPVYPIISNVTTTGCTVTCYNTQGNPTKATFNLTVKGW